MMEKSQIVEKAGQIITESGIEALTIEELGQRMGANPVQMNTYFRNDEEVTIFLLRNLEREIDLLLEDLETRNVSIEEKFQLLFELMFKLLNQKPYYLALLFNTEFNRKDENAHEILVRINGTIDSHLTNIINRGKQETVFKTTRSSRILVNNILGSFRSFMNQQDTLNKMLRDLEKLKGNQDLL